MNPMIIPAAITGASQIFGKLFGGNSDEEQLQQQGKLQEQQIKGAKELADYSQLKQQQNWENTNYPAQKKMMQEAGLNPALMYGQGGGGGTTMGGGSVPTPTAGQASDSAARQQNKIGMGLMLAQTANLAANTAKTTVEAKKLAGVDTASGEQQISESQSRQKQIDFQNAVNSAIGVDDVWKNFKSNQAMLQTDQAKKLAEWEAFAAGSFEGKATDDPTSPIAKAIKAGYEKTLQDLQGAKLDNNIKEATSIIENFKAQLSQQGLTPDSPWYVKIIGDMLTKAGINPTQSIGQTIK